MFRSVCTLAAGVAIGGAFLLAYRVSQETGKSLPEAFSDVPAEVQRLFSELKGRTDRAVDRGREAYHEKEAEMDEHLRGAAEAR